MSHGLSPLPSSPRMAKRRARYEWPEEDDDEQLPFLFATDLASYRRGSTKAQQILGLVTVTRPRARSLRSDMRARSRHSDRPETSGWLVSDIVSGDTGGDLESDCSVEYEDDMKRQRRCSLKAREMLGLVPPSRVGRKVPWDECGTSFLLETSSEEVRSSIDTASSTGEEEDEHMLRRIRSTSPSHRSEDGRLPSLSVLFPSNSTELERLLQEPSPTATTPSTHTEDESLLERRYFSDLHFSAGSEIVLLPEFHNPEPPKRPSMSSGLTARSEEWATTNAESMPQTPTLQTGPFHHTGSFHPATPLTPMTQMSSPPALRSGGFVNFSRPLSHSQQSPKVSSDRSVDSIELKLSSEFRLLGPSTPLTPPQAGLMVRREDIGLPRTPSRASTHAQAMPIFERVSELRDSLELEDSRDRVAERRRSSLWSSLPMCLNIGRIVKRRSGEHSSGEDKSPVSVQTEKRGVNEEITVLAEDHARQQEVEGGHIRRSSHVELLPTPMCSPFQVRDPLFETPRDSPMQSTDEVGEAGREEGQPEKRLSTPPSSESSFSVSAYADEPPSTPTISRPMSSFTISAYADDPPEPRAPDKTPSAQPALLHTPSQAVMKKGAFSALVEPTPPRPQPHTSHLPTINKPTMNLHFDLPTCEICREPKPASAFPARQCTRTCAHAPHTCTSCVQTWIFSCVESSGWDKCICPECWEPLSREDVGFLVRGE